MITPAEEKAAARTALFGRRREAHAGRAARDPAANARLLAAIGAPEGRIIAGYLPIRTEIDPGAAMAALHEAGARICAPVVRGEGLPLEFREWRPGCEMIEGAFGAPIPARGECLTPEIVIAPLLGWDRRGGRIGYGGGFYDRTLERLRARGPVLAIGFGYAAQELPATPRDARDQALDLIVTESETLEIIV